MLWSPAKDRRLRLLEVLVAAAARAPDTASARAILACAGGGQGALGMAATALTAAADTAGWRGLVDCGLDPGADPATRDAVAAWTIATLDPARIRHLLAVEPRCASAAALAATTSAPDMLPVVLAAAPTAVPSTWGRALAAALAAGDRPVVERLVAASASLEDALLDADAIQWCCSSGAGDGTGERARAIIGMIGAVATGRVDSATVAILRRDQALVEHGIGSVGLAWRHAEGVLAERIGDLGTALRMLRRG